MNIFDRIERWLRKICTPAATAAPKMGDEALKMAFGAAEGNPLWAAIMQVLGEKIENAADQVGRPDLAERPGAIAHTAGGLEWLRGLRYDLLELKADAEKKKRE